VQLRIPGMGQHLVDAATGHHIATQKKCNHSSVMLRMVNHNEQRNRL